MEIYSITVAVKVFSYAKSRVDLIGYRRKPLIRFSEIIPFIDIFVVVLCPERINFRRKRIFAVCTLFTERRNVVFLSEFGSEKRFGLERFSQYHYFPVFRAVCAIEKLIVVINVYTVFNHFESRLIRQYTFGVYLEQHKSVACRFNGYFAGLFVESDIIRKLVFQRVFKFFRLRGYVQSEFCGRKFSSSVHVVLTVINIRIVVRARGLYFRLRYDNAAVVYNGFEFSAYVAFLVGTNKIYRAYAQRFKIVAVGFQFYFRYRFAFGVAFHAPHEFVALGYRIVALIYSLCVKFIAVFVQFKGFRIAVIPGDTRNIYVNVNVRGVYGNRC